MVDQRNKRIKKEPKKPNGFEEKPTKPKKADNDNEDEEDKPGIADTEELGINQSLKDVIQSYIEDDEDLDKKMG